MALACLGEPFAGRAYAQTQYNTIALTGDTGTSLGFGPNLGTGVNFSTLGFRTGDAGPGPNLGPDVRSNGLFNPPC